MDAALKGGAIQAQGNCRFLVVPPLSAKNASWRDSLGMTMLAYDVR
jgi:hypothetical protein